MIIKVQLSVNNNIKGHKIGSRMLVYNEDRSFYLETETPEDVANLMDGRLKAFFYAKVEGSEIVIEKEAPHQEW